MQVGQRCKGWWKAGRLDGRGLAPLALAQINRPKPSSVPLFHQLPKMSVCCRHARRTGTMEFADGRRYEGGWKNGQMDSRGRPRPTLRTAANLVSHSDEQGGAP